MFAIRTLTADDIGDGLRLSAEAGWNQLEADWRRFLDLGGAGCFAAEVGGRVVGTVTTCRFGPVGWVAMLLVEAARRGRGIGRALLLRALEHLEAAGARSIRLDATPLGRPLYESLGFRVDFALARFAGTIDAIAADDPTRPGTPADLPAMVGLDRLAHATDRRPLLGRLNADNPDGWRVAGPPDGPLGGFVLWRPGAAADQIGPCVAGPDCGPALLDAAARRLAGRPLIIDLPTDHADAVAWAQRRGLRPTRDLWRMTRGEPVAGDRSLFWAGAGPEMG